MTKHPLAKGLSIALLAVAGIAATAPAYAASEADLLKQYVGDWRGRGELKGAQAGPVSCRMSLTQGNADKLIYNGRCTMGGNTMSTQGTVAWVPSKKQFVAAMTSNAQFSGQVVGQRRGDSIVFSFQDSEKDQNGKPINITARMTFAGGTKISTDFNIVYPQTGETVTASVPFSR